MQYSVVKIWDSHKTEYGKVKKPSYWSNNRKLIFTNIIPPQLKSTTNLGIWSL